MPKTALHQAERTWIEYWGSIAPFFGGHRNTATVSTLMVLRDYPMTIDIFTSLLHLSRATITHALREAENLEIIRSYHKPGDRKEYFDLVVGRRSGWEWNQWRAKRRESVLVNPSIAVCLNTLQHEDLWSDHVRKTLVEMCDGFRLEQQVIRKLADTPVDRVKDVYERVIATVDEMY